MTIELEGSEREAVSWLLKRQLPGLRLEIANTEDAEFRRFLVERETLLARILDRLERAGTAAAGSGAF